MVQQLVELFVLLLVEIHLLPLVLGLLSLDALLVLVLQLALLLKDVLVDERDLILILFAAGLFRAVILGGRLFRILRGGLRTRTWGGEKVSPRAHLGDVDLGGERGRGTGEPADRSENGRRRCASVSGADETRDNRSRRFGSHASGLTVAGRARIFAVTQGRGSSGRRR